MSNYKWYVLHSQPRKEFLLLELVLSKGIHCFLPYLKIQPVNPRCRKKIPYFPGYIFVNTDLEKVGLSTFQWMPYAIGLVSFDGIPASVSNEVVNSLISHINFINSKEEISEPILKPGENVLIQSGIFAGYEAIFDSKLAGRTRVRVLLKMMSDNSNVRVVLSKNQIKPKYG